MPKRVADSVLATDAFSEKFEFKLPEGKSALGTLKGLFFSFALFSCLIFYGTIRFIKLETFDDTDIMESSADAFYDAS